MAPIASATTINLFSGATNVGSLSYDGLPDPGFTGGFAGIQSTILFDSAQLTFNSTAASAFAVDNIVTYTSNPIPEPSAVLLVLSGAAAVFLMKGKRLTL